MNKLGTLLVVVFLGYLLMAQPAAATDLAQNGGGFAWDLTTDLFDAFISFLASVFA